MIKILIYTFIILWGGLAVFALKNIGKILHKYKQLKQVEKLAEWEGVIRTDFNHWSKKQIIIGCFLRFPYKVVSLLIIIFGMIIVCNLSQLFESFGSKIAKIFVRYIAKPCTKVLFKLSEQNAINRMSPIVISNHVNWFDIIYLISTNYPISFVAKSEIQKLPVIGKISKFFKCIYVERENSQSRKDILDKIKTRIQQFSRDSGNTFPLIIFPEGTTSNGRSILRFKQGAFQLKPDITIVSLNYACEGFDMGLDEITQAQHLFITLCLNPSLLVKHYLIKAKQQETSQQYMNRCQSKLSQLSGYPIYNCGFTEKKKLKEARQGKKQQ